MKRSKLVSMESDLDWKVNCMASFHANRKGKTREHVINEFLETNTRNSKSTLEKLTKYDLDIPYGDGPSQKVDIFYPDKHTEETSIVVFYHGGYWQEGSTAIYRYLASPVTLSNKILILVGKDLAPTGSMTLIVQQCLQSVDFICTKFPKAKSLTFSGHSAGGTEAALIASTDWKKFNPSVANYFKTRTIRFVLSCGIYELNHLIKTIVNVPLKMNDAEATKYSPINHVKQLATNQSLYGFKIALVEVQNDAPTIKKSNLDYKKAMEKENICFYYKFFENADHFSVTQDMFDPNHCIPKLWAEDTW